MIKPTGEQIGYRREHRLDHWAFVDGDRNQRQILREGEQPVGAQLMLDPEPLDRAHQHGRVQPLPLEHVHQRVREQLVANPVGLTEVDG